MGYYKFENLDVWKLARQFTNVIYKITKNFSKDEQFGLTSQIRRASVSIILNIAEGSDRKSDADYARFLKISKGSLDEVIAGCYIALDQEMITQKQFEFIYESSHNHAKKLNTLINYLKKTQNKGKTNLAFL